MKDIIERAKELIDAQVGSIYQYDDVLEEIIKELENDK